MAVRIATHDNLFHVDDLFACAVLALVLDQKNEAYTIVRTREKNLIAESEYVVDVGDIFDPSQNRFDHHQKGGAGIRENGIPYASIGLVWKEYGQSLCDSAEVARMLDEKVFQFLDADDNGIELYKNLRDDVETVTIHKFLYAFRPTWKEDFNEFDVAFVSLIPIVKQFIQRKIITVTHKLEAQEQVKNFYTSAEDKRIIVMDKPYPADDFLMEMPEPLYKVSPNANRTAWGVKTIRKTGEEFENRKDLPSAWGGLRDEELQKITGVADAIFCHNALFLATALSKDGAVALAKLAVDAET
jgi:uncharacterized UPF0160 family protein